MSDLTPCPFCGGRTPHLNKWTALGTEFTSVKCHGPNCKVFPGTGSYASEEAAIAAWNTRPERSAE